MTAITRAISTVSNTSESVVDGFGTIVDSTYPITKLMKIIKNTLDIQKKLAGQLSVPLKAVRTLCSDATFALDTLTFFSVMKSIWCKDKNGNYFFDRKKDKPNEYVNSLPKRVGMAFLGVTVTTGVLSAGERLGFYSLGYLSKASVGRVPVLGFVIRASYGVYKAGSAWDAGVKLNEARNEITKSKLKINKWENVRPALIENLHKSTKENISNDTKLKVESLLKKYEEKIKEAGKKEGDTSVSPKLSLWKERVRYINSNDYEELALSLEHKDRSGKITKWKDHEEKNQIVRKRNLVGLIESVTKVAATVLGLIVEAISYTALPCYLTVMGLGMISDVLSLVKNLMDAKKDDPKKKTPKPISPNGGNGNGGAVAVTPKSVPSTVTTPGSAMHSPSSLAAA